MTVKDDRAEFEAETRRHSLAMGQDVALFEEARDMTVKAGQHRYAYLWTWMGVPIIQMPSDIVVTQEIIWRTRPDVIIETGVARGGSLVFSASMLAMIGSAGKVIGVDIDIRAHNRDTIEKHPMASRITLIQGSSVAPETVQRVKDEIPKYAKVMIVLDSDHSRDHVLNELRAYGPLVTKGQYLIVADTLLGRLRPDQTPKNQASVWLPGNEPLAGLDAYLKETDRFEPDDEINGKMIVSSSPGGYLKCVRE